VNKTNIKFTPKEEILLQKGLKYNLHHKPKNWLSTLAIEAENDITLPPALHHSPLRYLVAQNIEHLYQQQQNTDKKPSPQSYNKLRTTKQIKQKLKNNEAIVTKADKGNCLVILYLKDYNEKVQNFIDTNHFQKEATDPTNKSQTEIRKNINLCTIVVPHSQRWKYINLNPGPPTLKGLPKIHKGNTPICAIVKWRNAPAYRLAKLISDVINKDMLLSNTFNVLNSVHLMTDLQEIPITDTTTFTSFDITEMYTNIPTQKLPKIINDICDHSPTS
jgi:hypothetical protein